MTEKVRGYHQKITFQTGNWVCFLCKLVPRLPSLRSFNIEMMSRGRVYVLRGAMYYQTLYSVTGKMPCLSLDGIINGLILSQPKPVQSQQNNVRTASIRMLF